MYNAIPYIKDNTKYIFNKVFGFTYSESGYNITEPCVPECSDSELRYIKNPFLVNSRKYTRVPHIPRYMVCYAHILVFLWKYCYPLIYIISHFRFSVFDDAGEANLAFREILKGKNQRILCLPRSIFIATTSKRFSKHGAMFIGCFFPSRHMHAWVIEDGMPADIYDNQWTLFRPLAMMK